MCSQDLGNDYNEKAKKYDIYIFSIICLNIYVRRNNSKQIHRSRIKEKSPITTSFEFSFVF